METLPALVIEQILSQLSIPDLLACSLVSIVWRSTFNCDYVWKKICFRTNNQTTIDYVRTVRSMVSPTFEEQDDTNLEPLCHWRVVYMKLQHVNRNWREANHATYKVTDVACDFFDIQIYNDTLVANVNDSRCEVWNIRGTPKKQESLVLALKDTCCKCLIHLSEDMLVIVQDTVLQVYKKVNKIFVLCYRRLFNLPEPLSADIPLSLTIDDWYKGRVKITSIHANVIGKYFIGLVLMGSSKEFRFHIWDTVTGSKLKEELVTNLSPEDSINDVKFCPPRTYLDKVLVCVQYFRRPQWRGNNNDTEAGYFTIVYLYDLKGLIFKTLRVMSPNVPWIFYEDTLFLTIDQTRLLLSIFNSSNGDLIASKFYREVINPDSVQVSGDYLGLTTGGDLVVLNIKQDFDLVFKTGIVKFSTHMFGFDFVFISWDLVLITCWDKKNKIEVWNIREKKLLSTLKANGLIFPCNNSTNFFVWNEMVTTIYMLKFW